MLYVIYLKPVDLRTYTICLNDILLTQAVSPGFLNSHVLALSLTELRADVPKLLRVVVGRCHSPACWINPAKERLVVSNEILTCEKGCMLL